MSKLFNATAHTSDDPFGPRGFPQATIVLTPWQKRVFLGLAALLVLWAILDWRSELLWINVACTVFYLFVTVYRVLLIDTSLRHGGEMNFTEDELASPPGDEWPKYMVILPMYHEGDILPKLVESLGKLDYPKDRLEIRLLIEADDEETMAVAHSLNLAPPFVITPIPVSQPRTKPKACNVSLE
ncbi:MAG: hypothetical protein KAI66_23615, partial [Lentisphaeria bacterium]|nr:hypothetical protein [Lentisphaeria bacterium]